MERLCLRPCRPQPTLDLAITVKYYTGAERIAVAKERICKDFFTLSTGVAGAILQKYINYHMKLAVYGDYSRYTSKPLHDFLWGRTSSLWIPRRRPSGG